MRRRTVLLAAAAVALSACAPAAAPDAPSGTAAPQVSSDPPPAASPAAGPVTGNELAYATTTAFTAARTARVSTLDGTGGTTSVTAGHLALDGTELGIQVSSEGIEVVKIGPVDVWVRVEGGSWAGLESGELDPVSVELVRFGVAQVDLANQSRSLAGFEQLDLVGVEDVAGGSARHYAGTTGKAAFVETQRPMNGVWLSISDTEPVSVDVWVDEQDRIVRFAQTVVSPGGTRSTFTTEYTDYGADLTVVPPA